MSTPPPFDPDRILPDVGAARPGDVLIDRDLERVDDDRDGAAGGDLFGPPLDRADARPAPRRRATPFRGRSDWVDLPLKPDLIFYCLAWVFAHPELPIWTTRGEQRQVRLLDQSLETQWDLYLHDRLIEDVRADRARPPAARQYDFSAWLGSEVPAHRHAADGSPAGPEPDSTARETERAAERRLFIDTLRRVARSEMRPQDLLHLADQLDEQGR